MPHLYENGYALLIGVNESRVPAWALPVVAKDVVALETVLVHPERCAYPVENVRKIWGSGATRAGIFDGLAWLRDCIQKDASGNATAVIFYSGHGWCPDPPAPPEFLLIPYDIAEDAIQSQGLRAEDFAAAVEAIKPERMLIIIDSCHSAGMVKAPGTRGAEMHISTPPGFTTGTMPFSLLLGREEILIQKGMRGIGVLSRGRGRAVLNSCTSEQLSYIRRDGEMSIFTYYLIEGLTGHAQPQEGASEVLVSDVMGHVSRRVPESVRNEWGKKQDPEYQISGSNFSIAMLLGGKGLGRGQTAPSPLEAATHQSARPVYRSALRGTGSQ
ncbi:MAG: caspase family protein [Chloroflexota bacterium]